jgi:hypothetical protein
MYDIADSSVIPNERHRALSNANVDIAAECPSTRSAQDFCDNCLIAPKLGNDISSFAYTQHQSDFVFEVQICSKGCSVEGQLAT